ncbi:olfactory receptor 10T2-like [Hemicordylus capensis]|uniref:olfactory receptor 10T2-like n=1 Tax=Hemicordylus capensis TaxID=884348 RepID=UPI0023027E71|nr:olfactory receptor 10T2-like [Hemicordylus capensis]
MKRRNETEVTEFVLTGFSNFPDLQLVLFVVFSLMYLASLSGNVIIMAIIWLNRSLHIPMYFFLSLLSFSESCYTFVIVPNMLVTLLLGRKTISFAGCVTQMFFFIGIACTNCLILIGMGYDRYVAVCHPLHYHLMMNRRVCLQLGASLAVSGFFFSLIETYLVFHLPFYGGNRIDHYFCDVAPVVKLACPPDQNTEVVILALCTIFILGSFLSVILSYFFIFVTVLRIPSAEGKRKAFSTCTSHLIVVIVHFGCASATYLRPISSYIPGKDIMVSIMYTLVTPLLNPIVYSLRNKDIQTALRKLLIKEILNWRTGRTHALVL